MVFGFISSIWFQLFGYLFICYRNCNRITYNYLTNKIEFFKRYIPCKPRPPSLVNIGATCYLNSAFQGISACNLFVKEINELYERYKIYNLKQLQIFKDLIDVLNGCSKNKMEISRSDIFREWNKPGQQDSYEVLAYALNQVYNELRKHKEDNNEIPQRDLQKWLEEVLPMRYILKYKIECGCKTITNSPFQSDLAFHVTITKDKEKSSLNELLDLYFDLDPIEDYQCEKKGCDGRGANRIARLIRPCPRTICIHLQRTSWNGYRMMKINNEVKFDAKLIIKSKYFDEEKDNESIIEKVGSLESNVKNDSITINIENEYNKDNENEIYNLISVIEHFGRVDGGHYVCYKKVKDSWFLTNDSSVREVSEETVLNCEAYILFYELSYK